jgi:hypothetical protein
LAWTTPITATANTPLTAAQWNATVRDNLNLTAPALATTAGSLFVGTGANAIAERIPSGATTPTQQTTASTTYTNLATVGPQVAVTTGTKAFVIWGTGLLNNTGGQNSFSSVSVAGATPTIVGTDAYSCQLQAYGSNAQGRFVAHHFYPSGLTAGSNTWTQVYRVDGGTGSFVNRELVVIPL